MKNWNFDVIDDRRGTNAAKYDELNAIFGRSDIDPFWIADMDFDVCPEISDALEKRMHHHVYGYSSPSDGYRQSVLNWVRNHRNIDASLDEIIYVPGIVRGIGFLINFFTKEGDKIVIQPPVYHPFRRLIEGNKRTPVCNPLVPQKGGLYSMNFDELEKIFRQEQPKMMILCNPHNPIGITWSKEDLRKIAQLSEKYGVIIVSDEIHADLAMFGNSCTSYMASSPEAQKNSIVLGAPSKTFNIPGFISSWLVIKDEKLRKPFFEWMEANEFSAPTFFSTIATEAAYSYGAPWLEDVKKYIEANIIAVEDYLKENIPAIKAVRPQASFLVWLDCRDLGLDHDNLISLFVDKAHLALNDGMMFGQEGTGFLRFNVATSRSKLMMALEHLRSAVATTL